MISSAGCTVSCHGSHALVSTNDVILGGQRFEHMGGSTMQQSDVLSPDKQFGEILVSA